MVLSGNSYFGKEMGSGKGFDVLTLDEAEWRRQSESIPTYSCVQTPSERERRLPRVKENNRAHAMSAGVLELQAGIHTNE